jgi:lysophospholipase L1-like esterase
MFRAALALLAGLAWLLAAWLSTHVSEDPSLLGRWSPGWAAVLACAYSAAVALTLCHLERFYRPLYAARGSLLLLALSTFVAVAGIEAFVRSSDLLGISYYEESRRYFLEKVPDKALVYRLRENLDDTFQGARVQTNAIGLRDGPMGPRQPGELRILLLGDSVAFGWGVRNEDIFPRRLERHLGHELGRPVRVINSGVGGYNTEQELAFLKLRGPEIAPDLVLLLYVDNDIEINEGPFEPEQHTSLAGKSPPQAVKTVLGYFWTYRLVVHVLEHRGGGSAGIASLRASAGWKRSMAALEGVDAWCRERRIPLAVFLYELVPNPVTIALREDIGALSAKLGFAYSSTEKWMAGRNPRSITNSIVDAHPNSAGHELLERGMRDFLLSHRGLLADASIIFGHSPRTHGLRSEVDPERSSCRMNPSSARRLSRALRTAPSELCSPACSPS